MSLYFLSFVHEPLSAGILIFAVSGQGMQLLLDRTWICPENGDAGVRVGEGLGVGDCSTGELPETILTSALQLPKDPGHKAWPRPISAPPPTSWAPPHFDSSLEETCTQTPSW